MRKPRRTGAYRGGAALVERVLRGLAAGALVGGAHEARAFWLAVTRERGSGSSGQLGSKGFDRADRVDLIAARRLNWWAVGVDGGGGVAVHHQAREPSILARVAGRRRFVFLGVEDVR